MGLDACGCNSAGMGWRTSLCTRNDRCEGGTNGQCSIGSRTSDSEARRCKDWGALDPPVDGMPARGNAAFPDPWRPSPALTGFTLSSKVSLGADENARLDYDGFISQLGIWSRAVNDKEVSCLYRFGQSSLGVP
jgi:hypothetical protein